MVPTECVSEKGCLLRDGRGCWDIEVPPGARKMT